MICSGLGAKLKTERMHSMFPNMPHVVILQVYGWSMHIIIDHLYHCGNSQVAAVKSFAMVFFATSDVLGIYTQTYTRTDKNDCCNI